MYFYGCNLDYLVRVGGKARCFEVEDDECHNLKANNEKLTRLAEQHFGCVFKDKFGHLNSRDKVNRLFQFLRLFLYVIFKLLGIVSRGNQNAPVCFKLGDSFNNLIYCVQFIVIAFKGFGLNNKRRGFLFQYGILKLDK